MSSGAIVLRHGLSDRVTVHLPMDARVIGRVLTALGALGFEITPDPVEELLRHERTARGISCAACGGPVLAAGDRFTCSTCAAGR